jgi:acetyl-CoA carboxylase carboxyl transferase subunit beta
MRNLFRRSLPGLPGSHGRDATAPDDMWVHCTRCRELIYKREWENNLKVCQKCGHHAQLTPQERIDLILDQGSFEELDAGLTAADPLSFAPEGQVSYRDRVATWVKDSGLNEAALYGRGTLDDLPVVLCLLDLSFFAGSLSAASGEKITRAFELAARERRPIITSCASGGARQQEGMVALMQMARTVGAVKALARARVPYVSVLTDTVLGGTTASFPVLADCVIAEPGAIIGFAGPRLVELATREKLSAGTDTAEFQLKHGMVDLVVPRRDLRDALSRLLGLFNDAGRKRETGPHGPTTTAPGNGLPVRALAGVAAG